MMFIYLIAVHCDTYTKPINTIHELTADSSNDKERGILLWFLCFERLGYFNYLLLQMFISIKEIKSYVAQTGTKLFFWTEDYTNRDRQANLFRNQVSITIVDL